MFTGGLQLYQWSIQKRRAPRENTAEVYFSVISSKEKVFTMEHDAPTRREGPTPVPSIFMH